MRWQTIRISLALVGLCVLLSWGIATFTYGSAPATDLDLAVPPSGASPDPTTAPTPASTPDSSSSDQGKGSRQDGNVIGEGTTAQVLNGSGDERAGKEMAKRLRRLGFEVVFTDVAAETPQTTVFWSSRASRRAARALANTFGWEARIKPPSIFFQADIHVLVGIDS